MARVPAVGHVALLGCFIVAIVAAIGQRSDSMRGAVGQVPIASAGFGDVGALEASYRTWKAQYLERGGDRRVEFAVGWFKGLSTEHSTAHGSVTLDLVEGSVRARIDGLPLG